MPIMGHRAKSSSVASNAHYSPLPNPTTAIAITDQFTMVLRSRPSARGELEITDVNLQYLREGSLTVTPLGRGVAWLDAGTFESLISSSIFVQTLEQRQGLKIACVEEIALAKGFIDEAQFKRLAEGCGKSEYGDYLWRVLKERQGPGGR